MRIEISGGQLVVGRQRVLVIAIGLDDLTRFDVLILLEFFERPDDALD